MIVEPVELGHRPQLWTKARAFAPQAKQAIADMLGAAKFADKAFVVLDWSNVTGQLPHDAVKPILYVQVVKDVPGIGQLRVEQKYDVDDIFAADAITPTVLVDQLHELKKAVEEAVRSKTNERH